ncbi:MAG: FAD-dependent oxidoreductase [Deltaproteobacteria bacterium]|nr:FAD-dependent oxidoreductase [Deltaproteobacteria bacterium]
MALHIDGKEIETEKGSSVLDAALEGGIYIPHLCHHPDLRPAGACRLCLVEVEGMDDPVASCTTMAEEGMLVRTTSERLDRMRALAMELILADHPEECVACSQYLNCELQSVKQYVGVTAELRVRRRRKPFPEDRINPLFVHDFTRCITCGRCVRACNELRGVGVLQYTGRAGETRVGISGGRSLMEAGCRFCGACVEVCPTGSMRDKEELLEGKKRREALVPCRFRCPAEIDVPRHIRFIEERKYSEATAVVREKAPFPLVLGHVCLYPCEDSCRRGEVTDPISIKALKLFAAERDTERLWEKRGRREAPSGKRVAIVGSGPAGLTAGYYLAKLGHKVTVFEALPLAGGMMRYGIPEYRLPRQVLEMEIREIEKAGVEIRTNSKVESLETLMTEEKGYDAVLVAVGTHWGQSLPIPGADLEGVLIGLKFLKDVNEGREVKVGKRVLVLGGGNVAIDCARVSLRLGAEEAHIACLESRETMPASEEEIRQGEEEGILLHPLRTFTRIVEDKGRVAGVECMEVEAFEFDEEGELEVETVEGSEQVIEADTVIFAVGQRPEIPDGFELETNERNLIEVDPYTYDTSEEGVFAAGDAVTGTGSVIGAIASGRKTAMAIDRYLGGEGDIEEELAPGEQYQAWLGPCEGFARLVRNREICGEGGAHGALEDEDAVYEASRCLRCDMRLKMTPVKFWGDY